MQYCIPQCNAFNLTLSSVMNELDAITAVLLTSLLFDQTVESYKFEIIQDDDD